jgi:signal transduction histidine kinase
VTISAKLSVAFCVAAAFLLAVGVGVVILINQLNVTLAQVAYYNLQIEQLGVAVGAIHRSPAEIPRHLARLDDLHQLARTETEREKITVATLSVTTRQLPEALQRLDDLAAYYRSETVRAYDRLGVLHRRAVFGAIIGLMDSIVLLVVLMYLVRQWLLRPLLALRIRALRMADGEPPAPVPATGGAEFAPLVAALNTLIASINDCQERAARAERFAAVGEATTHVAHNLSRPLASIRSLAEYERSARQEDPDARAAFEYIITTVDTLEHWVREMVHSARPLEFRARRQSLETIVQDALALVQPVASERKIKLQFEVAEGVADVQIDPLLFQQALVAVIDNAIDASADAGRVAIRLTNGANGHVKLNVRDDGEGIADDIKGKVFTPFFTTRPGRVGLGLTTAQRIVIMHHGSIQLDSEPDKGTTVSIELPAAPANG